MKNITFKGTINFDNHEEEINENELFSLKITDSLYKKRYWEIPRNIIISFHPVKNFLHDVQIKTVQEISLFLTDNIFT